MPETSKPTPRMYHVGDTVIITGREPKYMGLQAQILDFRYLPSSRRKGYYDYMVDLEMIDPPYEGKRLSLIQGNIKLAKHIPEGFLEERRQRFASTKQDKSAAGKRARALLKAHPELLDIARTEAAGIYSSKIDTLVGINDMSYLDSSELHKLLRAKLKEK